MTSKNRSLSDSSASPVVYIEDSDDFDQLLRNKERLLVDFYADWCGPCQMMAPVIEELAAEIEEATIVKVDVEQFLKSPAGTMLVLFQRSLRLPVVRYASVL